jgi:hypothetical protein
MQEFYRIESFDGGGFYRSAEYVCFPNDSSLDHYREFHPSPSHDKIDFSKDHIFGFDSIDKLKRWFYRDFVRKIKRVIDANNELLYSIRGEKIPFEANLFVVKYVVDERRDGIRQSVAIKKDLIQICAVPFEIFFKESLTTG